MFGFGRKKGGGKKDEEADLEGMMMDPEEMMKGLENDPDLMKELRELGGLTSPNDGGDDTTGHDLMEQHGLAGGAKAGAGGKPQVSAKAPGKPSAADAFLANLDMTAMEDAEGIGLIDEENMKFEDHDLDDTGLLAELGDLGWQDGDDMPKEGEEEEVNPPAGPTNTDSIKEVEAKMAECKAKALALRKEGKTEEAVAEMKKLRQLETELGVRKTLGVVSDVAKAVPTKTSTEESAGDDDPADDDDDEEEGVGQASSGVATDEASGSSQAPPPSLAAASAATGASSTNVAQQRLAQLRSEAENKRQAAVQMRKEGHLEEALSFMREAKALDAELARLMKRSSSRAVLLRRSSSEELGGKGGASSPQRGVAPVVLAVSPPKPPVRDAFTPLEEALNEACMITKKAALALKDKDKKAAVEELRKSKEYGTELETLRANRAIPGAGPAPFQWQVTTRKFQKVLQDVPIDSIELCIRDGKELYGTRRDNNPVRDKIFVAYDMGYPKDKPHTGHTAVVQTNSDVSATFNLKTFIPLQRNKAELMAFSRRSITLHVLRKRGLILRSDELMSEAKVELSPLLDHCEIVTDAPLFKEGTRRPCGGHVSISLRIREPLKGSELVEEHVRSLVLGPWPGITNLLASPRVPGPPVVPPLTPTNPALATTMTSPQQQQHHQEPLPTTPAEPKPVTPKPAVVEAEDERFKILAPVEKTDPLNAECIVSNDVFEYEIQLLATNPDHLDENDLAIREAQLNMRMNILVLKVQREELSLDQYTALIRERMERDRLLARYLTKEGRKAEAIRVLKRTKIMEQELATAAEGAEEG